MEIRVPWSRRNNYMKNVFNIAPMVKSIQLFVIMAFITVGMFSCDVTDSSKSMGPDGTMFALCLHVERDDGQDIYGNLLNMAKWYPANSPKELATFAELSTECCELRITPTSTEAQKVTGYQMSYEGAFCMRRSEGAQWFLHNDFLVTGVYSNPHEILVYELKFPALFGDSTVHHIVSKWIVPNKKVDNVYYALCESIEIDGKALEVKQTDHPVYKNASASAVTIILPLTIRNKKIGNGSE